MSQLTFGSIPGFFDLADAAIAGDQPLTDDSIQKISHNAKFAVVRVEPIYMGWYKNGDVIPTPSSPVDGYAYSRAECNFDIIGFATRAPAPGFVPGQAARPAQANANGGAGELYWEFFDVDDFTGAVYTAVSYRAESTGVETPTSDGMVKVRAQCIRASVNVAN